MLKKILVSLLILVVLAVLGFVGFVQMNYDKDYTADYPVSDLTVELDSARIARGAYLANGPAHCSHCHAPLSRMDEVEAGVEVPLTGGFGLEIPPGSFYAPNITPDKATGIGELSDGMLYRMLRHNINHKGHACIDFMPFMNMSEEDIYSIIAYLRVQEPVEMDSRSTELSFLGKMIFAMGAVGPSNPDDDIPHEVKKEASVEYGKYLAYAVANCMGCHTDRDMQTGKYIGEYYAGGLVFGPDNFTNGYTFVSPNLTPDEETGLITNWTLEQFIGRMKKGRIHNTSPMPWGAFTQMDTTDIEAIFMFLHSLDPVHNQVDQTVIEPGEET